MKIHSLLITPEILNIIAEIDEFRGGWDIAHQLTPERLDTLRHVATIESIGSSTRIEGVKLTDKEIETTLGKVGKTSFETRDEQEVVGYAETMELIFQNHDEIPFSENYLKQLHASLLRHSSKDLRHRGQYKTLNNSVEAFDAEGQSLGVVFQTASPFETPLKMQSLMKWTNETLKDKSIHPLLTIGIFNVVFLAIHPFQDGNGRLSRVISTLLLLKMGYNYVPYSSLESIVEKNKEGYYLGLRRTQGTLEKPDPDWLPWLNFFLRALRSQKKHLAHKMKENTGLSGFPADSALIIGYLSSNPRLTMKEAEQLTGTPRATLKLRFTNLLKEGLIVRKGKGPGTWYIKS